MLTYSINIGTVTEATSLSDINNVLNQIANNTTHLVSPKDVRDAVYTLWTTNIFKPTSVTASLIEYIGVDSSQTGINLKKKIYLGKRGLLGNDIMNNTLLSSDSDVFIYNTKIDTGSQNTKMSFLAGASSSFFSISPYVESTYVVGTSSNYLDFNIINPSGDVNIQSSSKNISLNGLIFPTISQNAAATNGYVLKYNNGNLEWNAIGSANLNTIYSGATVSIVGNPVLINGNNVEYTNPNPILQELGGITIGMTFSRVALVDMLNDILYPYLPTTVSFVLSGTSVIAGSISGSETRNIIVEYGALTSLSYKYIITKKSLPITSILSSPGGSLPPLLTRLSATSSVSPPNSPQVYTLSVTDGTTTISPTASISFIYPYLYTVTTSVINFGSVSPSSFTKVLSERGSVSVPLSGTNSHIYFLYPSSYGNLSHIIDSSTSWDFISSFTKIQSGILLTSSLPSWSVAYNVYSYTSGSGLTTVNSTWTFKH